MESIKHKFPSKAGLLSAIIFFLTYAFMTLGTGGLHSLGFFSLAFLVLLLLGIQKLIWAIFGRIIRNQLFWKIFILIPSVLFMGISIYESATRVDRFLKDARLAKLPSSASEVNYYRWSNMFAGEQFLSFQAPNEDIECFLSESPCLRNTEVTIYTPTFQRIPYPETHAEWATNKVDYFSPETDIPDWWDEEIRTSGKHYKIPADETGHNWGSAIYNIETGTIYINIIWS